jgi:hypothetical protein
VKNFNFIPRKGLMFLIRCLHYNFLYSLGERGDTFCSLALLGRALLNFFVSLH